MSLLLTLLPFALIASFTPGPNNILVMSQGMQHGLRSTYAYQFGAGIACFVIIAAFITLGAQLSKLVPAVMSAMRVVGCFYMLWLAWMVATAKAAAEDGTRGAATFVSGFFMQFVNPKYYLYVLTLAAGLAPVAESGLERILYSIFFSALAVAGMFAWAASGALLQRFLLRWQRLANSVMGLALVWCAVLMWRA